MKEYRCTVNGYYLHDCTGRDDIRERQGHYIRANSPEEALAEMAARFPEEAKYGFSIQEWKSFNVRIVEVKREDN